MKVEDRSRMLADYVRHHARGQAAAVQVDDLAERFGCTGVQIRQAAAYAVRHLRLRVGTSCTNLDGEPGPGTRGMGVFWMVTVRDGLAARRNIAQRIRPQVERLRVIDEIRPRVDPRPVEQARRELAAVTGEAPKRMDRTGQGLLLNPNGYE